MVMMRSSLPSRQYATPRCGPPSVRRRLSLDSGGTWSNHTSWPVAALRAAAVPTPVLMYSRSPSFNGVFWLAAGGVRFDTRCRTSDGVTDCRHTMRRFFTLSLLIWSSGEYLVLALVAA